MHAARWGNVHNPRITITNSNTRQKGTKTDHWNHLRHHPHQEPQLPNPRWKSPNLSDLIMDKDAISQEKTFKTTYLTYTSTKEGNHFRNYSKKTDRFAKTYMRTLKRQRLQWSRRRVRFHPQQTPWWSTWCPNGGGETSAFVNRPLRTKPTRWNRSSELQIALRRRSEDGERRGEVRRWRREGGRGGDAWWEVGPY